MNQYEATIGLEIHVQLRTQSKMFCRSTADYFGAQPNTHTCPVCLGLPGALPIINKEAINKAVTFALGLNCTINRQSKFDRKSYFYPDLPKGYQISQFDLPIGKNGWVEVGEKRIRINRVHQEEDTGKLIHTNIDGRQVSLIDFNRSGIALMEVVSEPDIDSPAQAKSYAKKVHQIARYLEVADVNMEKAGMRFDANISVKKKAQKELGEKVEIKNINSFRFLEKALAHEIERQIKSLESGEKIIQETRGWLESKAITVSQRTKESSPDYRYFPEPDLPPLLFVDKQITKLKSELPEMPAEKMKRFESDFEMDRKTAQVLTEDKYLAQWYEDAMRLYIKGKKNKSEKAKALANWISGALTKSMRESSLDIRSLKVEPASLVELLIFLDNGEINIVTAKQIFARMFETGVMPAKIIRDEGLTQVSGREELKEQITIVLKENEKAQQDFRSGKEASLRFLVGQVMRRTKGRANPKVVSDLLKKELSNGS
ncbi:Asp-tRNA(Asn)/Glu-tRNA(Gln) amidotransferase subunit GatB [Patescibacteria group bacterium]|nr:Asp-tRNA(Asn)/Glu-tRNA(Gln) amidotransferase subunit GatB [Patescibacteria group bacterium]